MFGGDYRLHLTGFLSDPGFLPFSVHFSNRYGANEVDTSGYRVALFNWGVSTTWLPSRPFPLRFFYNRTSYDSSGILFGQNSDYSLLGVEWTVRQAGLPHLQVGYLRSSNHVRLATSLTDNDYLQEHRFASLRDDWHDWQWELGFDDFATRSDFLAGIDLPSTFHETLRVFNGSVRRTFWQTKADFRADHRAQWRRNQFQNGAASSASESYTSTNLILHPTSRLRASAGYNFVRVELQENRPLGAPFVVLQAPTFSAHLVSARLEYRLTGQLNLFQDLRYFHTSPPQTELEVRKTLTESLSGANYRTRWHGAELSASYTGRLQAIRTTRGARAHTFSNDVEGRITWGQLRSVRLSGSVRYGKLNLVEQLNGFSEDQRLRLEAQSDWLQPFRLHAWAEHTRIVLLNLSGRTETEQTNLGLQMQHRRMTVSAGHTFGEGAGALFPAGVTLRLRLTQPLPVEQLLASPLLERTMRSTTLQWILRPRQQLDFSAHWRAEHSRFAHSDQRFKILELRARYRLAKVILEGGWAQYRTAIALRETPSGLRITRFYLRLTREFTVF
ncbi:MAG: hypothetical protein K6U02_04040 [Firmicutes bacterium]|nr:hypothetical protein [Bacillota bacterium]